MSNQLVFGMVDESGIIEQLDIGKSRGNSKSINNILNEQINLSRAIFVLVKSEHLNRGALREEIKNCNFNKDDDKENLGKKKGGRAEAITPFIFRFSGLSAYIWEKYNNYEKRNEENDNKKKKTKCYMFSYISSILSMLLILVGTLITLGFICEEKDIIEISNLQNHFLGLSSINTPHQVINMQYVLTDMINITSPLFLKDDGTYSELQLSNYLPTELKVVFVES